MIKNHLLNQRKETIFNAIVQEYLASAEPVGSRTIWKRYIHSLSPATIRNEMADLEEAGLITHPHTSAGRIPTDKGYRYYVDNLMHPKPLAEREACLLTRSIKRSQPDIEELLYQTVKTVSALCEYASVAIFPSSQNSSPRIYSTGIAKITKLPEFSDASQIQSLLELLDHDEYLSRVLNKYLHRDEIIIKIGREIKLSEMQNISIVIGTCELHGHTLGGLGVIGPTRMTYGKVTQIIELASKEIEHLLLT